MQNPLLAKALKYKQRSWSKDGERTQKIHVTLLTIVSIAINAYGIQ